MRDDTAQRRSFDIGGMHCAACARRIERRVQKADGIVHVQVNLATEQMEVHFDSERIEEDGIAQLVDAAGFSARLRTSVQEVAFAIGGMHCAACVRRVERALEKVEGVHRADVNLATNGVRVRFDAAQVKRRDLRDVVERAGYVFKTDAASSEHAEAKRTEISRLRRRLFQALLFWLPLFVVEMGGMAGVPMPDQLSLAHFPLQVGIMHLALAVPVMWIARQMYIDGSLALLRGGPNMFTLIAIGTTAAFAYSAWGLTRVALGLDASFYSYFPAVSTILTLVLLGRFLEARSRAQAGEAMRALLSLRPPQALLIDDGQERVIDVDEVEQGDLLRVRPGESLPADGEVVEGTSEVDESLLTGESLPLAKGPGDAVWGGSVNGRGALVIRATRVGGASLLAQMQRLVEEAQLGRAPVARLADVASGYFVPFVMGVAAVAALAWYAAGADATFAIGIFVSVLIIACPCSLGLATPAAIMVGTGRGAQMGILVKNPESLETSQRLDVVVLDKTGTLTAGKPRVIAIHPLGGCGADDVLSWAAAVEQYSEHPLATAIVSHARERGHDLASAGNFVAEVGQGARARVGEDEVRVGTLAYIGEGHVETDQVVQERSATRVWVGHNGALVGVIELADELRPSSLQAVRRLRRLGLDVVMLSGDRLPVVLDIAQRIEIEKVHAEVLPADKVAVIKALQGEGRCVAMVGDGINDAPALAQSDVGLAVASGVDVAASAADIVLMNSRIEDVARAVELSRATMRTIKQNLFWAFFYNAAGIPVAAGALYLLGGPLLNPMLASLAMAFSSVSVIGNALRLRHFAPH